MGTEASQVSEVIRLFAKQKRVLVIGGLGVIAHGMSRATRDADIWLDPLSSSEQWAEFVLAILANSPGITIRTPPDWKLVEKTSLAQIIDEIGMVRIVGLDCPLDLFRRPHQCDETDFSAAWERGIPSNDGTRIPDSVDLIITKSNTGRTRDEQDIIFLESLVRSEFSRKIVSASLEDAREMMSRYADYAVCEKALENPDPEVQKLARHFLEDFSDAGDPFSREILERLG